MTTVYIKQGNTAPVLKYKLDPEVNISGAAIEFHMNNQNDGVVIIDAAGAIEQNNPGIVSYTFTPTNTQNFGTFDGEFKVVFAGGKIITYPNKGYIKVVMDARLSI